MLVKPEEVNSEHATNCNHLCHSQKKNKHDNNTTDVPSKLSFFLLQNILCSTNLLVDENLKAVHLYEIILSQAFRRLLTEIRRS